MAYQNPAPANYDAYKANEPDGLCAVCADYGDSLGSAILPRLTPAEFADLPMPNDPDVCSHCGTRRVRKVAEVVTPKPARRRRRTRDELDAARELTMFVEETRREREALEAAMNDEAKGGEEDDGTSDA